MDSKTCVTAKTMGKTLRLGFCNTFNPALVDKERFLFAVRNTLSITICFVIAFFVQSSVFVQHSSTMPATLCLLISHFPGSALFKNLKRLLGVTLGKVLPIILLGISHLTPCGHTFRYITDISCLFTFTWLPCPSWA